MKGALTVVLFRLFTFGVFVDGEETSDVLVSVMEGDSVTLKSGLTDIQTLNGIEWRLNGIQIETFRDKLQLDNQTGDFKISNIRNTDSGEYKLKINSTERSFTVNVVSAGEVTTVSVLKGDSVTLLADSIYTQRYDTIEWRFPSHTHGLKLDNQTGSLTIKNTRTTHSGLYEVEISYSRYTVNKSFNVTVIDSGLSHAAVAGIVVGVLLAAACGFVIYWYCSKRNFKCRMEDLYYIAMTPLVVANGLFLLLAYGLREIYNYCNSKRKPEFRDRVKNVLVKEGEDVTLHTDDDIEAHDQILWTFEALDARLAEISEGTRETYDGADGIFRDRLMLDETGSLTIRNIEIGHTGVYILQIKKFFTRRFPLYKKFTVTVNDRTISVMEGDDVTLNTDTELSKEKEIKWLFGDQIMKAPIAEINGETGEIFTYEGKADGRFRNRLKLDPLTGSLSIKNTSPEHSGYYELQIKDCGGVLHRLLMVSVRERRISVENGNSVTLETEIQKDDQILWMFGAEETLIAQIKGETRETHDVADGRFRNRLKLEESGSLSISNITTEHTGVYKAQIISRGSTSYKKFKVVMLAEYVPVKKGDAVTLHTDSKIQKNDQIQWMFGDKYLIAEIKEGTGEISTYEDVLDGRFRDRLKLDEQTGSLTITNFRTQHTGLYKMKINRSTETPKNKSFDVFARGDKVNESVTKVKSLSDGDNLDVVNEQR